MTADFAVIELEEIEQEQFPESGNSHRKLTEPLGCTEMRINTVTLGPGETTAPHFHEQQEEVYIALDGGVVEIEGTRHDVSSGSVVRIGPDAIRSVRNDTDTEEQTWIMCGAPPLGTVNDFGQYRMPDNDN
ncbi:cupin domain-containing protein [Haloarcula amylolytica]|uniref:cupin domain-containing protein n=1 Tax=Haloarcula amylolytica TaxID=396317 RepID=UPI003C780D43